MSMTIDLYQFANNLNFRGLLPKKKKIQGRTCQSQKSSRAFGPITQKQQNEREIVYAGRRNMKIGQTIRSQLLCMR